MGTIKRCITIFNREGEDDLIKGEILLDDPSLEELQDLFNVERGNPMYDSYEIFPEHKTYFEEKHNIKLDLDKYTYFVEAYEEN